MKYNPTKKHRIEGHLDMFFAPAQDEEDYDEILIHGDLEGLKSLAKLLLELAELDQEGVADKYLPPGAREHYSLQPNFGLSKSSNVVTLGRLDAKGTKAFYRRFEARDSHNQNID